MFQQVPSSHVGALLTWVALFAATFVVMDFVWTHFVTTNPQQISLGDGVIVVGGGFPAGTVLGLVGMSYVIYLYWPRLAK